MGKEGTVWPHILYFGSDILIYFILVTTKPSFILMPAPLWYFIWLYSEFGIFLEIVKIGIVKIGIAKIRIAKIRIVKFRITKIRIVILGISKIWIKCY